MKLVALLPFVGPGIAKAIASSELKAARAFVPFLPTEFPKWNRSIDGLDDAGLWAINIERSRVPRSVKLPRVGQVWEATRDCEVGFHASIDYGATPSIMVGFPKVVTPPMLNPAFFPFGDAQLSRGERVRIIEVDGTPALSVTFQPLRYEELQDTLIPEVMRKTPGYGGYTLSLKTVKTVSDLVLGKDTHRVCFTEIFVLVQDVAAA